MSTKITKWQLVRSQSKVLLNIAGDYLKPVVTLQSGESEMLIAREQDQYTLYIKNPNGFSFYQPISYWIEEAVVALYYYLN
jgi:hypothetical protein